MSWLKISVEAAGAAAEALSERMLACGALSVSFAPRGVDDDELLEPPPGAAPLWPRVTLTGLFPAAVDAEALNSALGAAGPSRIDWLGDQDWAAARLGDMPAHRFGDRLAVVPRDASPPACHGTSGDVPSAGPMSLGDQQLDALQQAKGFPGAVLRLDPGLAFGTGQHPSTRSCLAWLADACLSGSRNISESVPSNGHGNRRSRQARSFASAKLQRTPGPPRTPGSPLAGRSVLDYGCGSGILGIAAALLGAAPVVAVDVEPQALWATQANADFNGVALDAIITAEEFLARQRRRSASGQRPVANAGSSDNLSPRTGDLEQPEFDVVIANILANTLIELGPTLSGCLKSGGQLVLAGILASQIEAVTAAYPDIAFDRPSIDGEWVRLAGRRRD